MYVVSVVRAGEAAGGAAPRLPPRRRDLHRQPLPVGEPDRGKARARARRVHRRSVSTPTWTCASCAHCAEWRRLAGELLLENGAAAQRGFAQVVVPVVQAGCKPRPKSSSTTSTARPGSSYILERMHRLESSPTASSCRVSLTQESLASEGQPLRSGGSAHAAQPRSRGAQDEGHRRHAGAAARAHQPHLRRARARLKKTAALRRGRTCLPGAGSSAGRRAAPHRRRRAEPRERRPRRRLEPVAPGAYSRLRCRQRRPGAQRERAHVAAVACGELGRDLFSLRRGGRLPRAIAIHPASASFASSAFSSRHIASTSGASRTRQNSDSPGSDDGQVSATGACTAIGGLSAGAATGSRRE